MLLAIDVGSSSVKAALLDGTRVAGEVVSAAFGTDYTGERAQVPVDRIETALREVVAGIDGRQVSAVGLTGMGPAWLAMAEDGTALTPVVTHQDRRSHRQAWSIAERVGLDRHLAVAGNVPTPGGISSTTAAWFAAETDVIDRAGIVAHLPTYLAHRLTGRWAIDPSNAGFTGLMDVTTSTWSDLLCRASGVPRSKLAPIVDAGAVIGRTRADAYGLPVGLPVLGGYVDGSGPLLVAGAEAGRLMHSAGSTDVLAVVVEAPRPTRGLLCRPLGTGGLWVLAATQAAGAAGLEWARTTLFPELTRPAFDALVRRCDPAATTVTFRPNLAGDRQSVDQPTGGFDGLTLATTREQLLAGVVGGLIEDHLSRLDRLLSAARVEVLPEVITTGGGGLLGELCRSRWPEADRSFVEIDQATLRGLGAIRG
jgi:xylulokinase